MGTPASRSGTDSVNGEAQAPVSNSQVVRSTDCQPLRRVKRPLDLPPPASRDIVLAQAKWAIEYLDFTTKSEGQPPPKRRRFKLHGPDNIDGLSNDPLARTITPQPKNEPPIGSNLVGYTISSNRSPENGDSEKVQRDSDSLKITEGLTKNHGENDSCPFSLSQSHLDSKKNPFIDEGYASFTASQGKGQERLELTEEALAQQLINSDNLRNSTDKPDENSSKPANPSNSDQQVWSAAALKARIERDGVEKSKRLREAANRRNSQQPEWQTIDKITEASQKSTKYTQEQFGILNMFDRNDNEDLDNISRWGSKSSAGTHTNSDGTIIVSGTKADTEDYSQQGGDDSDVDLFCSSQGSASPSINQEHMRVQNASNQPNLAHVATASSRYNDTPGRRVSDEGEQQLSEGRLEWSNPSDDLDAGVQKLKLLEKINERQKVGPRTLFVPWHEKDGFCQPAQHRPASGPKFYSPFGDQVRKPAKRQPETIGQFNHRKEDSDSFQSISKRLQTAQNRTGGLALLAEKGGHASNITTDSDAQTPYSSGAPAPRSHAIATVTADTFRWDFSRYKHELSQQEREVVTKHEWLKERQKDLKLLKEAYHDTAKLSCIVGVTKKMELELEKIDDFQVLVMKACAHNKIKRAGVQRIKESMIRRQTQYVPADMVEEKLGMIASKRSMQQIEDELKIIEDEIEVVSQERFGQSQKRGHKGKKHSAQPTKQVRFASPKSGNAASQHLRHAPDGTIIGLGEAPQPTRLKRGTEEYGRMMSAAFDRAELQKEAALRARLQTFENQPAQPLSTNLTVHSNGNVQTHNAREQDDASEVSEEDEGFDIYPTLESAPPLSKPKSSQQVEELALSDINRLEEERQHEEAVARPHPAAPAPAHGSQSAQAPDPVLAARMQRAHLGIPEQDTDIDSDASSDTSSDSDSDTSVQLVSNYIVYGQYRGIAELEDFATYKLGRFLKKNNAAALISEKVVEFCAAHDRDIATATAAGDEEWLARLGGAEEGTLRYDMKSMEQIVEYAASSCRIWMEMERVEARTRAEKEAVAPTNTYVALYERTMADGSVRTPSWDETVFCSGANGVFLANREAARLMGEWYGEHMAEGYLAMQRDALEEKVRELGEEALWDEEDGFEVPGGEERIRVWVDRKRSKT